MVHDGRHLDRRTVAMLCGRDDELA